MFSNILFIFISEGDYFLFNDVVEVHHDEMQGKLCAHPTVKFLFT